MSKSIFLLTALFLLLFLDNLNATTYYVNNISGNDGNSGTSTSLPWKTLAKVNGFNFSSGDVVSFKCGGRFSGTTIAGKSNITFNSYGAGARPVIDGQSVRNCFNFDSQTNITFNGLKIVGGGGALISQDVSLWHCTYVTFESCNIDSSMQGDYHSSNIYAGYGSNLTVRNSTISYGYQASATTDPYGNLGIYIDQCQNTLLEHDTIIGNRSNIRIAYGDGSSGFDWTKGLVVRYCVVKNGVWDNIDDDGSYAAQFYYNVFESGVGSWYHVNIFIFSSPTYSAQYGTYYNNTFVMRGGNIVFSVSPDETVQTKNMQFNNNIIYNPVGAEYFENVIPWSSFNISFNNNIYSTDGSWIIGGSSYNYSSWHSAGYDAAGKLASPLFTNYSSGDYSLQSGSPAINSGMNVGLTTDINGNTVPSNFPDIGAYQHGSGGGGGGGGTLPTAILNLNVLIESYYVAGGTAMTVSPWVTVELHNSTTPYALVDSNSAALNSAGTGTFTFTKVVSGTSYYIVVKSANTIAAWSALPHSFVSSALSYDFTTAITQAFTDGSNPPLALHNGRYCLYSGDLNQDGLVNKTDYAGVDNDNSTFNYHPVNDLNGDGLVSTADEQFIDNNYIISIHRQIPVGAQ